MLEKVKGFLGFRGKGKFLHFDGPSNDIWNRFYQPSSYDTLINTSKRVIDNKKVFVDYVLFKNFNPQGAIRISNPNAETKFLVSSSSFFNSSCTDYGGSIYLSSSGSFVQYKICSYNSKITGQLGAGSHSYIEVTNDDNHKNFVIESSFTQNAGLTAVLYTSFGSILFSSINISDSETKWPAALYIVDPSSLSATNYSNFDNTSSETGCDCIFINYKKTQNFYFCNFIDNVVSNNGMFWARSVTLSLNQCYFKGNKAPKLFFLWSGNPVATAKECHFESDNTFTTGFVQNSKKMTELILSNLYSSFLCEVKVRNKKYSIIIRSIPFSNLFSDQPSIPPA